VLATFNVPVEDAGHAGNAFEAACAILGCVAGGRYSNGATHTSALTMRWERTVIPAAARLAKQRLPG
jgi:hypothetical protein